MGDIIQLTHEVIEFEGEAKRKIDELTNQIAELWVLVWQTKRQFVSAQSSDEADSAHKQNVALRHQLADLLVELESCRERAQFLEDVLGAADRDRDSLVCTIPSGSSVMLIAESSNHSRWIAMKAQRRADRLFVSRYQLFELVGKELRLTA